MANSRVPGPLGGTTSAGLVVNSPGPTGANPTAEIAPVRIADALASLPAPGMVDHSAASLANGADQYPVISRGSVGNFVATAQNLLNTWLGTGQPRAVDARFGPLTEALVRKFQRARGIRVDGMVGRETWGWLLSEHRVLTTGAASAPAPAKPAPSAPSAQKSLSSASKSPPPKPKSPAAGPSAPAESGKANVVLPPIVPADSCCVSALTVKCGHGSRGFTLNLPAAPGKNLLKVVADADEEEIQFAIAGGPCTKGKPTGAGSNKKLTDGGDGGGKYPSVSFSGPNLDIQGLAPFKAGIRAREQQGKIGLQEFFQVMLWPDLDDIKQTYTGSLTCCETSGSYDFTVDAYPKMSWSGSFSIGYKIGQSDEVVEYSNAASRKPDQPLVKNSARVYHADDEGTFEVIAKVTGQYGVQRFTLESPKFERKGQATTGPAAAAFPGFKSFLEKFIPQMNRFFSNKLVKIKVKWPEIELRGSHELVERKGSFDLDHKTEVELSCKPIIGLSGSTDILNWLIYGGCAMCGVPATADVLLTIKEKAESGFGAGTFGGKFVCAIELKVTGSIDGSLKWERTTNHAAASGKIGPSIEIKVEGKIEASVRFLAVAATGGTKISTSPRFSGGLAGTTEKGKPALKGFIEFSGLTIQWVAYYSVGGSSIGQKPPKRQIDESDVDYKATKSQNEFDVMDPVKLLDAWSFPEADPANEGQQAMSIEHAL